MSGGGRAAARLVLLVAAGILFSLAVGSSVSTGGTGSGRILLPIVAREPSPTPVPTATPILTDDFESARLGWPTGEFDTVASRYDGGAYQLLVRRGAFYNTGLIDVGVADFTLMVDLRLAGANPIRRAGVAFGARGPSCNAASVDCYRLSVSSDGAVVLVYQSPDGAAPVYAASATVAIGSDRVYTLRVDRVNTDLAAWVSSDGGADWVEVTDPRPRLAPGAARGPWLGFVAAAADEGPGSAEARFDNLRLWRAGALPTPGATPGPTATSSPPPTVPPETPSPTPTVPPRTPSPTPTATRSSATIVGHFQAPGRYTHGITWDGSHLWLADNSATLFKIDTAGNVLGAFGPPDVTPEGLAWDGSAFFLFTTNRSLTYRFRIEGADTVTLGSFRSPNRFIGPSHDMVWDGSSLWFAESYNVYRLSPSGTVLSSFAFGREISGLDWNGQNLVASYDSTISLLDTEGRVLRSFSSPISGIEGLAWDGGSLWAIGPGLAFGSPSELYQLRLPP